jgi:tRNA1Val (adenine37-N6)-methyltransferase
MDFFEELCASVAQHLNPQGKFCLILPLETAELVKNRATAYKLYPERITRICSFEHSLPHRFLLSFGFEKREAEFDQLIIYQSEKVYHLQYQNLLQNFLTIF